MRPPSYELGKVCASHEGRGQIPCRARLHHHLCTTARGRVALMKLLRNPARWTAGGFARAEHHHLNTGDVDVPPPSPHDDGKTQEIGCGLEKCCGLAAAWQHWWARVRAAFGDGHCATHGETHNDIDCDPSFMQSVLQMKREYAVGYSSKLYHLTRHFGAPAQPLPQLPGFSLIIIMIIFLSVRFNTP